MKNHDTQPLIIVQNPSSTGSRRVDGDVLQRLKDANIDFDIYTTRFADTEDNIADFIMGLPDNAKVINAAGDGTAEQIANASIRGRKALTLGYLPFGNYNDIAGAHMESGQTVLDLVGENVPTADVHPLTIDINGEYWRHAVSYATIGLTAVIASGFHDEASRSNLRRASTIERNVRRYCQAGKDYLFNVGNKLPDFRVDDGTLVSGRTDIAFSNNAVVAGLIRSSDTYYDKPYFGVRTDLDMGSLSDFLTFGLPSLVGHSPLNREDDLRIMFEQGASIPFQSGGEYEKMDDVHSIHVFKNPKETLRVLHPKRT